jgi:hypothetical protein
MQRGSSALAKIDNGATSAHGCSVFDRSQIKAKAGELAVSGVFIGTSSWKYPGWRGLVYDESRHVFRGKFAVSRFEKNCLAEYAEVFNANGSSISKRKPFFPSGRQYFPANFQQFSPLYPA